MKNIDDIEMILGRMLRAGVTLAAVLMAAGLALMLIRAGTGLDPWSTPARGAVVAGLMQGDPVALITLGVAMLTLTPVLRVVAAAVAFARGRDWPLALASCLVLTLLTVGLVLGQTEAGR